MNGAELKEWRARNNFTQQKLAIALGVARPTIALWEKSSEPLSRMLALALVALETPSQNHVPVAGERAAATEYQFMRKRSYVVGSRVPRKSDHQRKLNSPT